MRKWGSEMEIFEGRITSAGFDSGHRLVIGDWMKSPLGKFTNVMWARPDGSRVLLSPSIEHANYVSELYNFEEVKIVEMRIKRSRKGLDIRTEEMSVRMTWGASFAIPIWGPLWVISTIEAIFARLFFGTKTFGITRNGRREWYSVRSISRLLTAEAEMGGESLGNKGRFISTACFGFSEPPSIPTSIGLKTYIE